MCWLHRSWGPVTIYLFFNVSCPMKESIKTTLTGKLYICLPAATAPLVFYHKVQPCVLQRDLELMAEWGAGGRRITNNTGYGLKISAISALANLYLFWEVFPCQATGSWMAVSVQCCKSWLGALASSWDDRTLKWSVDPSNTLGKNWYDKEPRILCVGGHS